MVGIVHLVVDAELQVSRLLVKWLIVLLHDAYAFYFELILACIRYNLSWMKERKLADRLSTMNESATLALNARVKQLAAEGTQVFNLTAGELADDTPEYIKSYVSDKLHLNKYTPVAGVSELRTRIAD